MRQNIYDDEAFFQGYADLRAQPGNLNDLVEQPALRALLPPLAGASVLDMGCGAGDLSAYCAGQGAARVVGADISERMLALARERRTRIRTSRTSGRRLKTWRSRLGCLTLWSVRSPSIMCGTTPGWPRTSPGG